jgi:NAD(P)-dependent dehydrogenase (short-subunit alcohol dehydrogenase family)
MNAPIKTALVTGAAKRLGRAIALDLAQAGYDVALHYNSSEADAQQAAGAIRNLGRRVALLRADLGNEEETSSLIARGVTELGSLGALINCASVFENDGWDSATRQSWDLHLDVNLRAPFLLSQQFAKALPEGANGAIVNIVDQRVLKPTPQFMSYSLSKAGLYWLNTTLAQALGPRIRVNAVAPGPTIINARQSDVDFRRQREATVLGSGADPGDVCAAVRYLLEASAVTGEMIAVDGGQHLIWKTPDVSVTE